MAKLGYSDSFSSLPSLKADIFGFIGKCIADKEEAERKKAQAKSKARKR